METQGRITLSLWSWRESNPPYDITLYQQVTYSPNPLSNEKSNKLLYPLYQDQCYAKV